ncbi:MAG: NAD(P)H-hydrate dehydratase, partial [Solobacterium sp.]|nr:NAD(P)H-hydrate dehydratase [Solobacterium sp.]
MRPLFRTVNQTDKMIISIDINSGCECDSGRCDPDAIRSDLTLALDCYKPFHMLRKHHHMFQAAELIPLGLPHEHVQGLTEMDEDRFLAVYPERDENAYKGTYGKTFIIAGSRGMAGALCLNLIGARTAGAGYVCCLCDESIYPLAAARCLTPVFYPLGNDIDRQNALQAVLKQASSVSFGSGVNRLPGREEILDTLLAQCRVPLVLDAEGLRMIGSPERLKQAGCPLILTPHIGEFSALSHMSAEEIETDRIAAAARFAKEYNVVLVLKGAHTIVASPKGDLYINQSGNAALAQAGSGDLLTGMIAGLLPQIGDVYMSTVAAVWLHGHLADMALQDRAVNMVNLDSWPELMNDFLFRCGR